MVTGKIDLTSSDALVAAARDKWGMALRRVGWRQPYRRTVIVIGQR